MPAASPPACQVAVSPSTEKTACGLPVLEAIPRGAERERETDVSGGADCIKVFT